ncbi:hypothetical protein DPMN_087189 [Dreissena polymorpha]|uniref:Uncharacterized protein n=1 Tax=Dreissena polymorpha TaxID=45954 RepID=A0A9D4KSI8_DREPO|nr:hypothetical protein DPMN_087189 [Dreissena polymorpha]
MQHQYGTRTLGPTSTSLRKCKEGLLDSAQATSNKPAASYYQLVFTQKATRTGSLYPLQASMPTTTRSFPLASASGTAYQKRR